MSCPAPRYAFRTSIKSTSAETWITNAPSKQPMPTIWKPPEEQEYNKEKQSLNRLFGEAFTDKFTNIETTSKIAASINCATALEGSDGSLVDGQMTFGWALENKEGS